MSEPKRYSIVADFQPPWAKMHEFRSGDWVKWDDYTRLKAEVERLKEGYECLDKMHEKEMERSAYLCEQVERLKKPAIIGGYNISEYIRMANSETLEFDNGDIFADMTLPERIKYIVESHASLKAEAKRSIDQYNGIIDTQLKVIDELKDDIKDLREDRIRMCDVTIEDIAVIACLKAEVDLWKLRSDNWQKLCQISKDGSPAQEYVGYYPNPVNLVPIKPAGDDKKGDAS